MNRHAVTIDHMNAADIPEVLLAWNRAMPHDPLERDRLETCLFNDPHVTDPLVARCSDRIVGLIAVAAKEASDQGVSAHIKALFTSPRNRRRGIATRLLQKSLAGSRTQGMERLQVTTYSGGSYFFPGVDVRYREGLRFFRARGFSAVELIDDVTLDLTGYRATPYVQRKKEENTRAGMEIVPFEPSMLPAMRTFVDRLEMPHWFPPGWEEGMTGERPQIVVQSGDAILGWAAYEPEDGGLNFGPIAILASHRGRGIGSWLLHEVCQRMQKAGCQRITAGWANTGFYMKNGWEICRQYVVFTHDDPGDLATF